MMASRFLTFVLATCLALLFVAARGLLVLHKAPSSRPLLRRRNATLRLATYRPGWLDAGPTVMATIRTARRVQGDRL